MCPWGLCHCVMAGWSKLNSPPGLYPDPQPQSVSLFQAKNTGADTRPGDSEGLVHYQIVQNNDKL